MEAIRNMPDDGPFLLEIRRLAAENSNREAYDVLYAEESLSQIESFYLWLMDRLALPQSGIFLDVSCGAGEVVRLAAQRGLQATGVDISHIVARVARHNVVPLGNIVVGNGEDLPFPDASFDFVTNIGSLEHFARPDLGAREIARVLRPGGRAFVLVPNTFSLLANIWTAFRTGRTAADAQPIQRYGARHDWIQLLAKNGLSVRQTFKYERPRPRTRADLRYYLSRRKELLRMIATPFVPLNLAWCFLFVCERELP